MTPNDIDTIARVIADAIRPLRDKAVEAIALAKDVRVKAATGIDDIAVEMSGDRTLRLSVVLTDGRTIAKDVDLPIPIHHGRWENGREYGLGDEVANNGCSWRAKRKTTSEPPSQDWLLVAKQGSKGGAA